MYSLSPHHRTFRHLCVHLKKEGAWQVLLLNAAVEQAISCSGVH
jgi:hypothetical protein